MKFAELRLIGHNIAHSLASGIGLLIGVFETDIFGEAERSPARFITVDFLTGTTEGGVPSSSLADAIVRYRDALVELCARHGVPLEAFRKLTACYSVDPTCCFAVTVENGEGKRSVDEYQGVNGHRKRILDPLGRIRRKKGRGGPA